MPTINLSQSAYDELKDHFCGKTEKTDWNVLHMKPEYTAQYLFDECKKLFDCYTWFDLDSVTSDRHGEYTVTFKPNVEEDEENKNKSANDVKGLKTITLPERLLLELNYFKATGKHLDIVNITLCAGSRSHAGNVPRVSWHDLQVNVYYCGPDDGYGDIRTRSAVSP